METSQPGQQPAPGRPAVIDRAALHVLQLYQQRHEARRIFHTYPHAMTTVDRVAEIARAEGINGEDLEVALLAACFLHTGYLFDRQEWTSYSLREARRFLAGEEFPKEKQNRVAQCLHAGSGAHPPADDAQRLLVDARQLTDLIEGFADRNPLLKLEIEFLSQQTYDHLDWARYQLQELLNVRLHTAYARNRYQEELSRLILRQKEAVEKTERKLRNALPPPPPERPFTQLETDAPVRGAQTFFRANYRNHINLSAIADNKANIMISVNAILISVLITFLSYRNIGETQPKVLLPVVIFLVTGLASLIFAVLSARPKVTSQHRPDLTPEEKRRQVVFFGNFVHLDLEEYEQAVDDMFRDSELLYGNLTRDLYFLGKVLDKKYRYLSASYNIFMIGFVATVVSFLIVFFS